MNNEKLKPIGTDSVCLHLENRKFKLFFKKPASFAVNLGLELPLDCNIYVNFWYREFKKTFKSNVQNRLAKWETGLLNARIFLFLFNNELERLFDSLRGS